MLIWILVAGTFGILNTEMGVIGILPYVARAFNVDIVTASLLISLFALGVGVAGPTMPLLCSRLPRKPLMIFVLGLFTICNVASIFTTEFDTLLMLRVIPSIFHPVYCAMAFSIAAELGGKNAPREVAKINIGVSAGMVVGVPISNFLAETFNLETAFGFFALVTALALAATIAFIPTFKATKPLSYGAQVGVLRRSMVWASIAAVLVLNGSGFGCFNYRAADLSDVPMAAPT
ncbi:MAG: MFS transporter, partial [Selenomonadaceae bacterium]|nr:MFS transporter [Selenomonadaceae bacterium]